ncbi:MAG TPA: c-type cytochrome [Vicinamibacterales bacterium]|nr:c-type cytochrome [Vicinamibacterales bacterium]
MTRSIALAMRRPAALALLLVVVLRGIAAAQAPEPTKPGLAESPTITVLKGLMVPQFEVEMRHFVQALGMNCGGCHIRGNFASDDNPRKATARRMIEMTRSLNQRFFPDFTPAEGETSLGRVTCYTCHQGSAQPKASALDPGR